eukprot:SAG22_NODE_800_length_7109_cov_47.259058_2_plen_133_part_00
MLLIVEVLRNPACRLVYLPLRRTPALITNGNADLAAATRYTGRTVPQSCSQADGTSGVGVIRGRRYDSRLARPESHSTSGPAAYLTTNQASIRQPTALLAAPSSQAPVATASGLRPRHAELSPAGQASRRCF